MPSRRWEGANAGMTSSGSPSDRLLTRFTSLIHVAFADPVAGTYRSLVVASAPSSAGVADLCRQAAQNRLLEPGSCSPGRPRDRLKSAGRNHSQPWYCLATVGGSRQLNHPLPMWCDRNHMGVLCFLRLAVVVIAASALVLVSSRYCCRVRFLVGRLGKPLVPNSSTT